MSSVFLPDRFRPRPPRRRSAKPWMVLAVVAILPLMAPGWRVQAVEIEGCPGLPPEVTQSLQSLVGRFALMVDPQWIRRQVEVWPVIFCTTE